MTEPARKLPQSPPGGSRDPQELLEQAELERLRNNYDTTTRAIEWAGMIGFFSITPYLIYRAYGLAVQADLQNWGVWLAAAIVGGMVVSDFATGLVHWAADNWGSADMPVIGNALIRPFRHHHIAPKDMIDHDFVEQVGMGAVLSLGMFLLVGLPVQLLLSPATGSVWLAFVIALGWAAMWTNKIHGWAHMDEPPKMVALLMRARLVLPAANHHRHHQFPHDESYCITTGWLNGPLRWIRFWEGVEWCITAITGIVPLHKQVSEQRRSSPEIARQEVA